MCSLVRTTAVLGVPCATSVVASRLCVNEVTSSGQNSGTSKFVAALPKTMQRNLAQLSYSITRSKLLGVKHSGLSTMSDKIKVSVQFCGG